MGRKCGVKHTRTLIAGNLNLICYTLVQQLSSVPAGPCYLWQFITSRGAVYGALYPHAWPVTNPISKDVVVLVHNVLWVSPDNILLGKPFRVFVDGQKPSWGSEGL